MATYIHEIGETIYTDKFKSNSKDCLGKAFSFVVLILVADLSNFEKIVHFCLLQNQESSLKPADLQDRYQMCMVFSQYHPDLKLSPHGYKFVQELIGGICQHMSEFLSGTQDIQPKLIVID